MIVSSADMFEDMPGVLASMGEHIGLPEHDFANYKNFQHESTDRCAHREFLATGGRYASTCGGILRLSLVALEPVL